MSVQLNARGRWEVRWLEAGRHRARVFSFAQERAALRFERETKYAGRQNGVSGAGQPATVGLLGPEWIRGYVLCELAHNTQDAYVRIWDRFLAADPISGRPIGELSAADVRAFAGRVRERVKADLAAENQARKLAGRPPLRGRDPDGQATVAKTLAVLSSLVSWASEDPSCEVRFNPVCAVTRRTGHKRRNQRKTRARWHGRPLSAAEVAEMVVWLQRQGRGCGCRDAQILEMLRWSGLRPQELFGLDLADVCEDHVRVRQALTDGGLEQTKSLASLRRVSLSQAAIAPFRALADERRRQGAVGQDPLLINEQGRRFSYAGVRNWGRRAFATAAQAIGRNDTVPYTLRHSRAHDLCRAGCPIAFAAAQLGHSAKVFSDIYAAPLSEFRDRQPANTDAEIAQARAFIRRRR